MFQAGCCDGVPFAKFNSLIELLCLARYAGIIFACMLMDSVAQYNKYFEFKHGQFSLIVLEKHESLLFNNKHGE